jgi:hypothetical protein
VGRIFGNTGIINVWNEKNSSGGIIMKRIVATCIAMMLFSICGSAFANLNDTRSSVTSLYGEYRMLIDTDNQPWTKAEWDTKGFQRAKAASYMHYFSRNGLGIQMEVQYGSAKEQAFVKSQRFTPNMPIKVKELRSYFPEMIALLDSPKAQYFTTYKELTRLFQENQSPVTMGVVIRNMPTPGMGSYNTLIAFNIQEEGRIIKDPQFINGDTYIREFIIQQINTSDVTDNFSNDWHSIKKFF